MESNKFLFRQENRKNWDKITANLIHSIAINCATKDLEVEIREIGKKRSGDQLKAYWCLIKIVKEWMNAQGNYFTDEAVSGYFKIESGHCSVVNMQSIPKSISNKSDCSVEQMEKLITTILIFGAEHGIDGCEIEDSDFKNILNYYGKPH